MAGSLCRAAGCATGAKRRAMSAVCPQLMPGVKGAAQVGWSLPTQVNLDRKSACAVRSKANRCRSRNQRLTRAAFNLISRSLEFVNYI